MKNKKILWAFSSVGMVAVEFDAGKEVANLILNYVDSADAK
jgi:hypothetical protein